MYFNSGLILNSGAIERLQLSASFDANGCPKPIILVGPNGSGKTNVLSILTDALLEIAAQHFQNALPEQGAGHRYFRILGSRTQRSTSPFELSLLRFSHNGSDYYYRAKAGKLSAASISNDLKGYGPINTWPEEGNSKTVVGPNEQIAAIYNSGIYAFFSILSIRIASLGKYRCACKRTRG